MNIMLAERNWKRCLRAIFITIILSLALHIGDSMTSENNISTGKFLVSRGISKPSSNAGCWIRSGVKKQFTCFLLCARNVLCDSFFIVVSASNAILFDCWECKKIWSVSTLDVGNDQYVISKFGGRGVPAPTFPGATLQTVAACRGGLAAFYICPEGAKVKEFKLAYDDQSGSWPELPLGCQESLCNTESVDGVMLKMSKPSSDVFRLDPICEPNEGVLGYTECTSGVWSEFDNLLMLCIPRTCQKVNSRGRSVYQGYQTTTSLGTMCKRWDTVSFGWLADEGFPEDLKSMDAAANYCRDPGEFGYVMCMPTDQDSELARCDVPNCV